ncbi:uncharacterized protein [Leptinotarsa decemlineata]|uniref:uncharacterized protein n=1 Tax=Leptinotarsa decemlineata TaxID=7539 RepID=UPI003D304DD9
MEDASKWYRHVPRVQRVLNSAYQRSINTTPAEVLFGVKLRNKEDIKLKELLERDIIEMFNEERNALRENARKQIEKVQEENRRTYNLRRKKAKNYKEGDLVAIKRTQFGPGLKLAKKFLGPYEVLKVKPNERYDVLKVGIHEGPIKTSTCAEFMKPWVEYESESESDSAQDGRM